MLIKLSKNIKEFFNSVLDEEEIILNLSSEKVTFKTKKSIEEVIITTIIENISHLEEVKLVNALETMRTNYTVFMKNGVEYEVSKEDFDRIEGLM